MSRIRRQCLSFVAPVTLAATLFLASCLDDPSGPGIQPGYLALAPSFESSAAGIVDVASVHVRLIRDSDETVALDDTFAIDPESETVDLSFSVMVTSSGETFTLDLECLSPTGEVVFRAEGLTVTATTGDGDNVVAQDVPIQYVGVGSNAASVTILTAEPTVRFGDTLLLTAEVLDSSGTVIEGTPIMWISHDTTRVVVPDAGEGRIVGNRVRDWVHVEALLLTGPADTADVMVYPVPNTLTVVSGNAQSGTVNTELTNPIAVRVDAVDGPMAGVPVEFATADDGYFGLSSVITDVSGQASTTWTLGSTIGVQTGTATVDTFVATFTATAGTPYEPTLGFTVQPSRAALAAIITPAVEVTALDGFGLVDEAFSGAVSIAIANNPSGGTLSGTTTVPATGGIATFGDLSIDLSGTGYTLTATATGYAPATSMAFNIEAIPPGTDAIWDGTSSTDWNDAANWSTATVPTDVENVWIPQAPVNQPTVGTSASVGTVVVQQGATVTINTGVTLSVFGDLDAGGSIIGGGAYVDGNLTVRSSADVSPGCDIITVTGDLVTTESGTITMTCGDFAQIVVDGNANFGGGSTVDRLTNGQLTVRGNFAQSGDPQSFAASGFHTTLLSRDGGQQTVSFTGADTLAGSHFANLTIRPSAGGGQQTTFNSLAYATGSVFLDDNIGDGPTTIDGAAGELIVSGDINTTTGGAGINLQPAVVRVGGAFNLTAGVSLATLGTEFFGTGAQTIPNRTDYFGVIITGDSVNFDGVGPATIGGDLFIVGEGLLDLDSATVTVNGSLSTQDQGRLRMDVTGLGGLTVSDNVSFGGGSTDGTLTAGTMNIGGNFEQLSTTSDLSFAPSLNHLTLFNGSTTQTIDFASPDSLNGSHFNNLEIRQTDGEVTLNTQVFAVMATIMDFDIATANPAVLNGTGEIIVGDGFTSQSDNTGLVVEPFAVRIGDYLDNQGTFQPTVTEFFGLSTQSVPSYGNENYTDIIASGADVQFGTIDIGGNLTVTGNAGFNYYAYTMNINGDLVISGNGSFTLWESNVTVGGNFRTEDSGTLSMSWATDVLDVNGNSSFGGGNTGATLSAGTLHVAGGFDQITGISAQSFAPGPDHMTVLDGTAAQQVTFESPTLNESRFGDLRIDNTSADGVVLNTPVLVRDDFLTPATAVTRNVFGRGNTITMYSVDIQDVVFDNTPLDILYDSDYASFSEMSSVTLQNMDPTIVQIQIDRGSEMFTFAGITFAPFTTGGGYLHLDGAFYTMVMQTVPSTEPVGAVTTVNGADYCWDSSCG